MDVATGVVRAQSALNNQRKSIKPFIDQVIKRPISLLLETTHAVPQSSLEKSEETLQIRGSVIKECYIDIKI